MSFKNIKDKLFSRYLFLHLLAMTIVALGALVGVIIWLNVYTHHGEAIVVPELKGMSYDKASALLQEKGLAIVVSDSGYNKKMAANTILAQTPDQGLRVKQGRIVYVTVNSLHSPTFAIPDVIDNASVREAEAKLQAMGFKLSAPQLVEGEKDWVYGILCGGRRVAYGDRISIESTLTLMVGKGNAEDMEDAAFNETTDEAGETDDFVEVTEPPTGN